MDEPTSRGKVSIGPTHVSAEKTSITCSNMPESLFDAAVAKRHFGKFGRVTKILLRPKKQACVIDYDSNVAAQKALLNAGAYDGYMFDVTWTKRKKKRARKEEDPDWVPDSDVEEELSAMSAVPTYRPPRQQPMQQNQPPLQTVGRKMYSARPSVARERQGPAPAVLQQASSDSPAVVSIPTSMSTAEAAAELRQLRHRVSRTPDEQRRTLDARDRVLRAWGGTGARVREGGATIGTCPDMCPEKERLQRQAEHQVMVLELEAGREGSVMAERRAVKQYSRSSADQETPMCYELRPPATLTMTMDYLLREVADCSLGQVSLADWFHFMWDRCRGIRKDITQQALCCAESVRLVEQCARFHAHCAARLADLEHSAFDPRLNTDNLTKCLQSLKHMYADLRADSKPCEAEFRSYIALLNLGDANFCWEIKQLHQEIQKSDAITFAVEIFMALDNNNYVRFFRLVRDKATYLQACILLRYFNDVRARGLARIVKAFAPRGGSKYPVKDLMENLAFEDLDSLKSFISHYGLKLSRHDDEDLSVILDRNQFIEDSDPYPISRAVQLIESKRNCSVGEIIAGAKLTENISYMNHSIHSSFNDNGTLKTSAILAEDQGYGTRNESNKNLNALRKELDKTPPPDVTFGSMQTTLKGNELRNNLFIKPEAKSSLATKPKLFSATNEIKVLNTPSKIFSFKPAIPVVSPEVIKSSPEKLFTQDSSTTFSFSNPDSSESSKLWKVSKSSDVFQSAKIKHEAIYPKTNSTNIFFNNQSDKTQSHVDENVIPQNLVTAAGNIFGKPQLPNTVFGSGKTIPTNVFNHPANPTTFYSEKKQLHAKDLQNSNVFKTHNVDERNKAFLKETDKPQHIFGQEVNSTCLLHKPENSVIQDKRDNSSVFGTARQLENEKAAAIPGPNIFLQAPSQTISFGQEPAHIFKPINATPQPVFGQGIPTGNLFTQVDTNANKSDPKSVFGGSINKLSSEELIPQFRPQSPKSLFKTPFSSTTFGDSRVLNAAFGPFTQQSEVSEPLVSVENQLIEQRLQEEFRRKELEEKLRHDEAQKLEEQKRHEEMRRQQLRQQEEMKNIQDEKRKQEELRQKILEEKKQADLKRIAEELRVENEKKKAEERRRLLQQIDKESQELVDELTLTINEETVVELVSEELEKMKELVQFANIVTDEILKEITNDVCLSETKAEKFLSEKLMEKFSYIWRVYTARNIKRRMIVKETPIWLANKSPLQTADLLKRQVLPAVLAQMNAFHRGYRFSGKTKPELKLQPYNIMELVRSSLLKGLRRVKLQYHECFFWKVTLSSPDSNQWLNKQVNVHDWLLRIFSNKDGNSECDDSVIYLKKHSWNNLMHFAISVTLTESQNKKYPIDGSNGIIFFTTEEDKDLLRRINYHMQEKVSRHVLPLAIVTPNNDTTDVEKYLTQLINGQIIPNYRIFKVCKENSFESIDKCTKSALRWLAKNIPDVPPLEMDTLRSILHQYVGTELWFRLKLERQTRMKEIYKDLHKLIALYNLSLEKLANLITDPNIFDYPIFPAELKMFLVDNALLPKSYEFFPNNWMNIENMNHIKEAFSQMYLPQIDLSIYPQNYIDLQAQIHEFCNKLDWFENPTEVAYKILSYLPHELSDSDLSTTEFVQLFERYDFLDIVNVIVIEKINSTSIIKENLVVYDKAALSNYRKWQWLHEIELLSAVKHKAVDFTLDEIDHALNESFVNSAKRMKLNDSDDLLALEDKDQTLVEELISNCDTEIVKYNAINATVNDIEKQLAEESLKASNLEELLRSALHD